MSFILRQISRTADGREIVRQREIASAEVGVGRLADNDIHLADLAVEPRHAVIRRDGAGRVHVESLSGLGFDHDGRTVQRADIDPVEGAELRFGSHRLRLAAEGDAITVTIERVEALSDALEVKDQQTVFTLRGLLPGKRISAYGFIALVLAAFLVWPIYSYASYRGERIRPDGIHGDKSWSSGKLSQAHAELEGDCQACHTDAFVAVRDTACIACHTGSHDGAEGLTEVALSGPARPGPAAYGHAPADKMRASEGAPDLGGRIQGFFKASFNVPEGRCVDCHTEHEGAGKMPATAQAFCTDCHEGLQTRLTRAGFRSGIGSASDFGAAHPQFRPLVLAGYDAPANLSPEQRDPRLGGDPLRGWRLQRTLLDRPIRQEGGLKFTHAQHLSTSNAVARMWSQVAPPGGGGAMDCADCHKTDASGTRYQPVEMETACQSCHSLGLQTVGGTVRQLPHGQPEQVIADIRAFYSSNGSFRPAGPPVARYTRQRPGEANAERRAADMARASALQGRRDDDLIRATFAPGGLCGECHTVTPGGPQGVRIAPVAQPVRYLQNGWFDHRPHENLAVRGRNGARTYGCRDCHAAEKSNDARDLLLPAVSNCQSCHTGESGRTTHALVRSGTPSSCAMCHDYHADEGAPWVLRRGTRRQVPANRVAMLSVRWR